MVAIANPLATPAGKLWGQLQHVLLDVVTVLAEARMRRAQIEIDRYLRIRRSFEDNEHGPVN
jgi:hypothetical protein